MKIPDYDPRDVSQEQLDFNDDVRNILNNSKYQRAIVTAVPAWTARAGEEVYVFTGNGSGSLYMCSTDNSSNWVPVVSFPL